MRKGTAVRSLAPGPRAVVLAREMERHMYFDKPQHLRRLLVVATDRTARGLLEFQLAHDDDPNHSRYQGEAPENTAARRELARFRYERVLAQYADVDGGALAKRAESELRRVEVSSVLRVGRPAPPTAGVDVDGKPMDLADFKGQVVVLDFWGSWCGSCIRVLPKLKHVADNYAGRGVVVLGVMSEWEDGKAEKAVAEHGVTWRNWVEVRRGEKRASPLADAWDIGHFPTLVVIDRQGVIRAVDPDGREGLEKVLDELLAKP